MVMPLMMLQKSERILRFRAVVAPYNAFLKWQGGARP
jgi:hypothetical protein